MQDIQHTDGQGGMMGGYERLARPDTGIRTGTGPMDAPLLSGPMAGYTMQQVRQMANEAYANPGSVDPNSPLAAYLRGGDLAPGTGNPLSFARGQFAQAAAGMVHGPNAVRNADGEIIDNRLGMSRQDAAQARITTNNAWRQAEQANRDAYIAAYKSMANGASGGNGGGGGGNGGANKGTIPLLGAQAPGLDRKPKNGVAGGMMGGNLY